MKFIEDSKDRPELRKLLNLGYSNFQPDCAKGKTGIAGLLRLICKREDKG